MRALLAGCAWSKPIAGARALAAVGLLAATCAGCGQNPAHGGDLDHIAPLPPVIGTPIAAFNAPPARPPMNTPVTAHAVVVVAVDAFDETADGKSIGNIYVEDPIQPTPWSGITLFRATLTPSNLKLRSGDIVDISGPYAPFAGPSSGPFSNGIVLPEITKGGLSLASPGAGLDPVDITLADLKDAVAAMQFVGRLVRLKNVTIHSAFDAKRHAADIVGDASVTLASQLVLLDDPAGIALKNGDVLKSATGLLNYFYSFSLSPRDASDVER